MSLAVQMMFVVFGSFGILMTLQNGLRRLAPGWIARLSDTNWKSMSVGAGAFIFCLLRDTMGAWTNGIWDSTSMCKMDSFVALMILSMLILFQLPNRQSESSEDTINTPQVQV